MAIQGTRFIIEPTLHHEISTETLEEDLSHVSTAHFHKLAEPIANFAFDVESLQPRLSRAQISRVGRDNYS